MAIRLVKIAKELNIGTRTIVEFLSENGFEIENKPTAKVDKEMHDVLLKEFSQSLAVREQANKLVLGNQNIREKVPEVVKKAVFTLPSSEIEEEKPKEKIEEVAKEKPVEVKAKVDGPKVIGKIDLDKIGQKRVDKSKDKKTDNTPSVKEEKPEKPKEERKEETAVEAPKEEMVRAKTPKLQGLKVLGKIDKSKLDIINKKPKKPKKTKKEEKKKEEPRKRKRTRKKVSATNFTRQQRGGFQDNKKKSRRDEVKEVSKKEIEDKIKATMARLAGGGKKRRQKIRRDNREEKREKQELQEIEKRETTLKVTEFISVSELASLLDVSVSEVITTCMNLGVIVSINQRLDAEIIELVATEFEQEIEFIGAEDQKDEAEQIVDDPKDLVARPPIVTVMGHVDHGKTSLLDFIRNANVAESEAGGITQHIGAYEVNMEDGHSVTFLDTPGHEAFTAMRARGAKVTDVVVIIIAADDRIMPQTKEAISHAQAAGVPMIFAINKIDKDGSQPERIKQELSSMNLLVEDWGGSYQSQDISAKTGLNIDKLLEKIILESELLEVKANPNRNAVGAILEASLDKGKGYVSKILVQNGTLNIGDAMVAGGYSGKIKAMFNERGQRVQTAGPSCPVMILGLSGAPRAGEGFKICDTEQEARQLAAKRSQIDREQSNRASKRISLDEIGRRLALGTFKELNLVVKGDVDGSIEALSDSLIKLSVESIQVNVIHKAVGQIVESDVLLASASDAIIIGFQVRPSLGARQLAEKEDVQIKSYSIIYEAIDEIKSAMEGMLEPTKEERVTGLIEVRETYKISKIGTIAGSYVLSGLISRNAHIRVIRDGIVVYPVKEGILGEMSSLKRFKDDAKEVKKGMECGITIKNFNDIKVGDQIETYEIIEIQQTLD